MPDLGFINHMTDSQPKTCEAPADQLEEQKTIQALTAKEIKNLARPEFQKNFAKYYPENFFKSINFHRHHCTKCGKFFWAKQEQRDICGDSNCQGKYTFIGTGMGIGQKGQKLTYSEAWDTFERSFTSARIPCTKIKMYPTVARWRNDVDYVAAGIYCFQPYCVTGEMQPPANPLICPQFCVRFNDLDNIGLTGRHYSGFIMIGIQVFNYPDDYKFFKEECVEFNYNWLTKELQIDDSEITYVEDIWAGGGNMGPSIEYFVRGMEIGNMVFMQFKTFHDGSYEELKIKVIDTGIGLERVAWLVNGDATSYITTFKSALQFILKKLDMNMNNEIWNKLGPLSCQLDVDECANLEATWTSISQELGLDKAAIKAAIEPIKDIFIILDHTRTAFFLIRDGSLPSNIGGGSNLRNIIRRTFAILAKNNWWDKLTWEGYMELFAYHEKDLEGLCGKFKEYSSFGEIMKLEYTRWATTDESQSQRLKKLIAKKPQLTLEDWYVAVTSWGIPSDTISKISGNPIPDNLYYYIDEKKARIVKAPEKILYDTVHLPETVSLYFDHLKTDPARINEYEFNAQIVEVLINVSEEGESGKRNVVVLDKSSFYPTSGGQSHDIGVLTIEDQEYKVVKVEKVGKAVLHFLDKAVPEDVIAKKDVKVKGVIDRKRRLQLRNHHTAAHIIFAASREVLGPHVWQNGAKKTEIQAHLDITHYASLTYEEEIKIQDTANRIVMGSHPISKTMEMKDHAEKEHGFRLYQGGVVPGNTLRIVEIENVDVEACCGTHCDNTAEVGWIKITSTKRIADGILRIYFVAGERTIDKLNEETAIINEITKVWSIPTAQIVEDSHRKFKEFKKLHADVTDLQRKVFANQVRYVADVPSVTKAYLKSNEDAPTLYFSFMSNYAKDLVAGKKAVVFQGETFLYAFLGYDEPFDTKELTAACGEGAVLRAQNSIGAKKDAIKGVQIISVTSKTALPNLQAFFEKHGFKALAI
jgi:alanyl-tRNA synthetase